MIGFGQSEAADGLGTCEPRQPMPALFVGTVTEDREHDQRTLHAREAADAAVAALELLHHQSVHDIVRAAAAVFLRQRRTEHTEFGHARLEVQGKASLARCFIDHRLHFARDKTPHGVAHHQFFFLEEGIYVVEVFSGLHMRSEFGRGERKLGNPEYQQSYGEGPRNATSQPRPGAGT